MNGIQQGFASANQAWVGTWKERKDLPNAEAYVRQLRKGKRLTRISS
jgi:hypothetical protein